MKCPVSQSHQYHRPHGAARSFPTNSSSRKVHVDPVHSVTIPCHNHNQPPPNLPAIPKPRNVSKTSGHSSRTHPPLSLLCCYFARCFLPTASPTDRQPATNNCASLQISKSYPCPRSYRGQSRHVPGSFLPRYQHNLPEGP